MCREGVLDSAIHGDRTAETAGARHGKSATSCVDEFSSCGIDGIFPRRRDSARGYLGSSSSDRASDDMHEVEVKRRRGPSLDPLRSALAPAGSSVNMSEASTSTSTFDPAKQEALAAYRKVSARLSPSPPTWASPL